MARGDDSNGDDSNRDDSNRDESNSDDSNCDDSSDDSNRVDSNDSKGDDSNDDNHPGETGLVTSLATSRAARTDCAWRFQNWSKAGLSLFFRHTFLHVSFITTSSKRFILFVRGAK